MSNATVIKTENSNRYQIKVGAITYKSLADYADVVAKRTGESSAIVYSRMYQRLRTGKSLKEIGSSKPLPKGKLGELYTVNGKEVHGLLNALKVKFPRKTDEVLEKLHAKVLSRLKAGYEFNEACEDKDFRAVSNGKEIKVGEKVYASLVEAVKAHFPKLSSDELQSEYVRFHTGLKKGKTFEEIAATPKRVYNRQVLTIGETNVKELDEMTELLENALATDEAESEAA